MKDKNKEKIVIAKDFFIYYTIVGFLLFLLSVGIYLINPAFAVEIHANLFNVTPDFVYKSIYIFLGIFKLLVFFTGFLPAIALLIISKKCHCTK